jgi:flagellar assembly protein FliH
LSRAKVLKTGNQPRNIQAFALPTEEEYVRILASMESTGKEKDGRRSGPGVNKSGPPKSPAELTAEADQIIVQAKQQAEGIRTGAFNKGYAEGVEKARKEEGAALNKVIAGFQRSLEELARLRERGIKDNELEIIDLALDVARKIIGSELASDPQTVAKVIRNALSRVRVREGVSVRVNPEDHVLLSQGTPDFLEAVKLVPDPDVARGGAVIESSTGNLDAQIEEQLAEIEKSLKKGVVGA